MDPTVLYVLALIAADPAAGDGPQFNRPTVAAHVAFDDSSSAEWNVAKPANGNFQYPAAAESSSADVATPLGSVETVLRGQSPVVIGQPVITQGPVVQSGPIINQPIDPTFQNGPIVGQPLQAGVSPILPPVMMWKHYAVYENVFLAPYFSQNTAAVVTGGGATTVRQFDWDLEYSSRVEVGVVDSQGAGWRARYWHFDHSEKDGGAVGAGSTIAIAPDAISGTGIVSAPASGGSARATHSLRMSVIDLEYLKQGLTAEPGFDVSFGLRYARMDQWLNGWINSGGAVQTNSLKHDFEGIGPTIATEYSRPIWFSSWSVFGNARASLLYGDTNYRYSARNAGGVFARSRNTSDTDLLSVFEMQLGVEHRCPIWCCHELFVRAALEGQYWANAGSASQDLGGVTENAQDADMGFFGFIISTGLDW